MRDRSQPPSTKHVAFILRKAQVDEQAQFPLELPAVSVKIVCRRPEAEWQQSVQSRRSAGPEERQQMAGSATSTQSEADIALRRQVPGFPLHPTSLGLRTPEIHLR